MQWIECENAHTNLSLLIYSKVIFLLFFFVLFPASADVGRVSCICYQWFFNKLNEQNQCCQHLRSMFFFFIFLNTVECGTFVRNWNMSKLWVTISYALNARPIITMCPRVLYANEHRTMKTERKKKREWKKRKKKIRMHWALRPQFFSVFFENKSRGINIKIEISRRRRKKKMYGEMLSGEWETHNTVRVVKKERNEWMNGNKYTKIPNWNRIFAKFAISYLWCINLYCCRIRWWLMLRWHGDMGTPPNARCSRHLSCDVVRSLLMLMLGGVRERERER